MKHKKYYLTVAFIISCFSISHLCKAQCHPNDWNALKAIYESLGGEEWRNQDGWDQISVPDAAPDISCNLSNLYGVKLDAEGRVTELDLATNILRGSIPPEIGDLSNLTLLSFYYNLLEGPIPNEIGNLVNLTHLNLGANTGSNNLTGTIPKSIGNLTNLQELNLRGNELTGSIPVEIANLTSLTKLDLGINDLTGSISIELTNLINLTNLSLSSNDLTGNLIPELGNMQSLEFLSLGYNNFTGEIPDELENLTSLKWLTLSANELTGVIPASLVRLSNLYFLSLDNNNLTGSIPVELSNLINLEFLDVSKNNLSGCYDNSLLNLFSQLSYPFPPDIDPIPGVDYSDFLANKYISEGNTFYADWYSFGTCFSGACANTYVLNLEGSHDINSTFYAYEVIYSAAKVNSTVQYIAVNEIQLNDGFQSSNAYNFNAKLSSCRW